MEEIIKVENLTKDYGHGRGIFNISLSVGKGEVFGFLGPNGAGKSTTIRHIMGFSKPQSGSCNVFGMESFKNYYKILDNVGYLPGEIALPEGLTGWEFIRMMGKLRGAKSDERLNYLLKKFEFDPKMETKKMSLGDKRKLAIVTAFMNDPDVLILDEPTSGLDPVMQQVFVDFIKEEKKRNKTIFLSSHIFNEVEDTCDRIAIIKDGFIVSMFETNKIKHNENKRYFVKFEKSSDYESIKKQLPKLKNTDSEFKKPAVLSFNNKQLEMVVAVNDKNINELVEVLSSKKVQSFYEIKFTLEDYFMRFYKEDKDFGGVF